MVEMGESRTPQGTFLALLEDCVETPFERKEETILSIDVYL